MVRNLALSALLAALAAPAGAEVKEAKGSLIKLPSGAEMTWQETLHDSSGGQGLTYRFRFVMPDLAKRMPDDRQGATGQIDAEERAPIEIDTETGEVGGAGAAAATASAQDYAPEAQPDQPLAEVPDIDGGAEAEAEADGMLEAAQGGTDAAPADDSGEDPLHADILWLCQNWVLPRVASPAPRPSQIIVSIADKELPFGSYDADAHQVFEAFRLPADRDQCQWEPW
ncbi:MAG: DUF6497 family protein [Paracoccus sp. (in: a-proteobacteria)]|uniref:DUF6497 family protein n=1 Tax=Paracoccus sp. TaxID=267 RepID=UPI0039E4F3CB